MKHHYEIISLTIATQLDLVFGCSVTELVAFVEGRGFHHMG